MYLISISADERSIFSIMSLEKGSLNELNGSFTRIQYGFVSEGAPAVDPRISSGKFVSSIFPLASLLLANIILPSLSGFIPDVNCHR